MLLFEGSVAWLWRAEGIVKGSAGPVDQRDGGRDAVRDAFGDVLPDGQAVLGRLEERELAAALQGRIGRVADDVVDSPGLHGQDHGIRTVRIVLLIDRPTPGAEEAGADR